MCKNMIKNMCKNMIHLKWNRVKILAFSHARTKRPASIDIEYNTIFYIYACKRHTCARKFLTSVPAK